VPDANTSPQGSGKIKCQILITVGSGAFIVATALISMMKIWSFLTKGFSLSNPTLAMIVEITSQHQIIRNFQMLIRVCKMKGLAPLFLARSSESPAVFTETSYTQIAGKGIDRRPEK
jgi:hypothetical protein